MEHERSQQTGSSTGGGNGNGSGKDRERREIWGIVDRDGHDKGWWTKIGVAFPNSDGSWFLRFDYMPARAEIKLQMRKLRDPMESSAAPPLGLR